MLVRGLMHALSAEYLFFKGAGYMPGSNVSAGLTFDATKLALMNDGQPAEHEWPYQQSQPLPWVAPAVGKIWKGDLLFLEDSSPAAAQKASLMQPPFVLAVKLTSDFFTVPKPSFAIPSHGSGFGGHAVLVVGLGRDTAGEMHFLIRNSWGETWGDHGHAWLPVSYLKDKLIGVGTIL